MNEELLAIARRLGFETLESRNSDRLDFREVGVLRLKDALEAAFEAGKRAASDEKGQAAAPIPGPVDEGRTP